MDVLIRYGFTMEEINRLSYDHSLLCRIIGTITNTYDDKQVEYLVCGDGALGIMEKDNIDIDNTVFHFNDLLCKMLLGGISVEAITNKDIGTGSIHDSKAIWPVQFGHSWNSHIHAELRMKVTGVTNAIFLYKTEKNTITIDWLKSALEKGDKIIKTIPNLSTYHLIKGITDYRYRNWSSTLTFLWVVVEEIIDYLWKCNIIDKISGDNSRKRKDALNDSRTYTTAVKQEVLFQKRILSEELYNDIFVARQARNKLIHEGKRISESDASKVYKFVLEMLSIVSEEETEIKQ